MGSTYLLLKITHIFAATLFLGNLVVTGYWKAAALRTGDLRVAATSQRLARRADALFSGLGALILSGTGAVNATLHFDYHGFWLFHGGLAFLGMIFLWCALLIPVERKLSRMAAAFPVEGEIPADYFRWSRVSSGLRAIVVFMALCMLYLMVYKPHASPL